MSSQEADTQYAFDGQLVFNGLYSTNVLDAGLNFDSVVENELNDFSKGEPGSPSRGYELLKFAEFATQSHLLGDNIKNSVEDIQAIRRKYESWDSGEDIDGNEVSVRSVNHYDIYWDVPDYLFVKGNKTQASRASDIVQYTLGDYISATEIEFHPDFLLWLFYRFKSEDTQLNDNFKINLLSDAEIEGEKEDRYGKRSRVDKSTDITKSTTVLIGMLKNKDLTRLEGVFDVVDKYVKANIEVGGRVHVKASHSIEGAEDVYRMSLAITFLRELVSLYEDWIELPGDDKYPPLDFFTELYEECEKQGAELTFPYDDVVETYRQRRNQGEGRVKQSDIDEFK